MSKKLVSKQEIVDFINKRLKEEYDGDITIRNVTPLAELNQNGCNWSQDIISSGGIDVDISHIINEAQTIFNIK